MLAPFCANMREVCSRRLVLSVFLKSQSRAVLTDVAVSGPDVKADL